MDPEPTAPREPNRSVWTTVTPLSKYLALALFVVLPFIGFWAGYTLPKITTTSEPQGVQMPITEDLPPPKGVGIGGQMLENQVSVAQALKAEDYYFEIRKNKDKVRLYSMAWYDVYLVWPFEELYLGTYWAGPGLLDGKSTTSRAIFAKDEPLEFNQGGSGDHISAALEQDDATSPHLIITWYNFGEPAPGIPLEALRSPDKQLAVVEFKTGVLLYHDPVLVEQQVAREQIRNDQVQSISWIIEKTHPEASDESKLGQAQTVSVDVNFEKAGTRRYELGAERGCTSSTEQSIENGRTILGRIYCTGPSQNYEYVAFIKDGNFVIEANYETTVVVLLEL